MKEREKKEDKEKERKREREKERKRERVRERRWRRKTKSLGVERVLLTVEKKNASMLYNQG